MASFNELKARAVVVLAENVDTDQIIPARFLKTIDKDGLGKSLFADWRYLPDGSQNPDFPLNQPNAEGAEVLIAGDNFGCGSSREHAPWALLGFGIRAVISTSFADIFKGNALKNGLLPVEVDAKLHARLLELVRANPRAEIQIDLAKRELRLPDGTTTTFPIDGFAQHCLLNGLDQLGYILSFEDKIEAYEGARAGATTETGRGAPS
jgi:3-isopropylmalate/(R)-2-methylmalate dehydratase small subunit